VRSLGIMDNIRSSGSGRGRMAFFDLRANDYISVQPEALSRPQSPSARHAATSYTPSYTPAYMPTWYDDYEDDDDDGDIAFGYDDEVQEEGIGDDDDDDNSEHDDDDDANSQRRANEAVLTQMRRERAQEELRRLIVVASYRLARDGLITTMSICEYCYAHPLRS